MRAALTCFPHVRHPSNDVRAAQLRAWALSDSLCVKPQRVQLTAGAVGALTVHADREISTTAALSLQQFALLSPRDNLIHTLHCFLDLLCETDFTQYA